MNCRNSLKSFSIYLLLLSITSHIISQTPARASLSNDLPRNTNRYSKKATDYLNKLYFKIRDKLKTGLHLAANALWIAPRYIVTHSN